MDRYARAETADEEANISFSERRRAASRPARDEAAEALIERDDQAAKDEKKEADRLVFRDLAINVIFILLW